MINRNRGWKEIIMFFDIENYNTIRLTIMFLLIFVANIVVFRNKLHSFIDPLLYHLIWLSSIVAFCIELAIVDCGLWSVSFMGLSFFYNFLLFIFSRVINKKHSTNAFPIAWRYYIFLILILLYRLIFQDMDKWTVLFNEGLSAVVALKFVNLAAGRNIIITIIDNGLESIFSYILFYIFFFEKVKARKIIGITIFMYSLLSGIILGGRSYLIILSLSIGFFLFYFRSHYEVKRYRFLIVKIAPILVVAILVIASFISTLHSGNVEVEGMEDSINLFEKGLPIVYNRVFANADGIDYFIRYNGQELLDPENFVYNNFGVFLNSTADIKHKSMGQQLIERVYGHSVDFAQGPNFFFLLQSSFFNFFAPLYLLIITCFFIRTRYLKAKDLTLKDMYFFFLASNSFGMFTDSELYIFTILLGSFVFMLLYLLKISWVMLFSKKS